VRAGAIPILPSMSAELHRGTITVVDAFGCDAAALRSVETLAALFEELVRDLDLHPLHAPAWHRFPGPGGITGFVMLTESHLACHTFPENGLATIDLYCCRARPAWDWRKHLAERLGAGEVRVRALARGGDARASLRRAAPELACDERGRRA
jgi:S-adenosylmethionine decarboxylase